MNVKDAQIGQIVLSTKGRDKDNYFVIASKDDQYVYIVDGDIRTLEKPKKKKRTHVVLMPTVMPKLAEKWSMGESVFDSEIRSGLKVYKKSKGEEE